MTLLSFLLKDRERHEARQGTNRDYGEGRVSVVWNRFTILANWKRRAWLRLARIKRSQPSRRIRVVWYVFESLFPYFVVDGEGEGRGEGECYWGSQGGEIGREVVSSQEWRAGEEESGVCWECE